MRLEDFLPRWPGARVLGTGSSTVGALTVRAQDVTPGSLYFAIRGKSADGHAFLEEAFRRGAVAAVVEDAGQVPAGRSAVVVPSTRAALADAACLWFGDSSTRFRLVAVTGTNGKTTTTFLLSQAWEALGRKPALLGTVEARIGSQVESTLLTTPDPLALQNFFRKAADGGATDVAFEASSIALDQERTRGSHVSCAVFTNLTQDHLDYHGTMDAYFQAKRRLFFDPPVPPHAIINVDDLAGRALAGEIGPRAATFSATGTTEATLSASEFRQTVRGLEAHIAVDGTSAVLYSPLLGAHNLSNLLGALGVLRAQGVPLQQAVEALAQATGAPGRLERVALAPTQPSVFVDYAHTDDALARVLEALRPVARSSGGRLLTVFGCGGDRDAGKRPKMGRAAAENSDVVVVTSDNPRTENPDAIVDAIVAGLPANARYFRETDRRSAIQIALEEARPEDIVLIAGKGHETYQIVGHERRPFDDRAVVRELSETR